MNSPSPRGRGAGVRVGIRTKNLDSRLRGNDEVFLHLARRAHAFSRAFDAFEQAGVHRENRACEDAAEVWTDISCEALQWLEPAVSGVSLPCAPSPPTFSDRRRVPNSLECIFQDIHRGQRLVGGEQFFQCDGLSFFEVIAVA